MSVFLVNVYIMGWLLVPGLGLQESHTITQLEALHIITMKISTSCHAVGRVGV